MQRLLLILGIAMGCDNSPSFRPIRPHTADPAGSGADDDQEDTEKEDPPEEEDADWPSVDTLSVDVDDLMTHLEALQAIAEANGGHRAAGTSGYDASVDYAAAQLEDVGYVVSLHEFNITQEIENQPPVLEVLTDGTVYEAGTDFTTIAYTGSGEAVGPIVPVDLQLPPGPSPNDSSSGCEAGDFFGFPEGGIALIQRGSCAFADKATLAMAAGAAAVLIFNEGQEGRRGLFSATLGGGTDADIPVLIMRFEVGEELAESADAGDTSVHVLADVEQVETPTVNLIAESPGATEDVVVVGGHLDSVSRGPGINDNGSGAMLILEMARVVARDEIALTNPIRWVLWGGEELGLLGSLAYVRDLDDAEHARILANLNFDMVASPNPVRFVYDGDGSETETVGPTGSGQIEAMFLEWFEAEGLETEATPFDGRSDYGPFIWSGIPAGGLFTGAEQEKTMDQVDVYGGQVGQAYDSCYHQECDTIENVDPGVYAEIAAAAGHAVLSLGDLEGGFSLAGPPAPEMIVPMVASLGGCHAHAGRPEAR